MTISFECDRIAAHLVRHRGIFRGTERGAEGKVCSRTESSAADAYPTAHLSVVKRHFAQARLSFGHY